MKPPFESDKRAKGATATPLTPRAPGARPATSLPRAPGSPIGGAASSPARSTSPLKPSAPVGGAGTRPAAAPAVGRPAVATSMGSPARSASLPAEGQGRSNNFSPAETTLLHEALTLAGFKWYDGDDLIMGKKDELEVAFRLGSTEQSRWAVMAFPLYDMNMDNSAEVCLHFLTEAYSMVHLLDFQYQIGINMETEHLEFLIQLPVSEITGAQLGELIKTFFEALAQTILEDLQEMLARYQEQSE